MAAPSLSIEEKLIKFKSHHKTSHLFKIDNFALLKKYEIKEVESSVFNIGGFKLRLILYPNGNENDNGKGHISIYLEFQGSGNARFRFQLFVVSQLQPNWHAQGTMTFIASRRKKEGSPRLISLADLETKGYLIGDCCLFGAKLLGIKEAESGTAESFSLIEMKPPTNRWTWKMAKYSAFNPETDHMSDEFIIGNRKWRIQVFPRGDLNAKGKFLSVNMMAKGFIDYTPKTKTYAHYTIRVLKQDGPHRTKTGSNWFSEEECGFGWSQFMELRDVSDYLVDDNILYVGVEIEVVSTAKYC